MFERGSIVTYGFRTGTVLRLERRHRQDGAVVEDSPESRYPGDGIYPHWIPLSMLTLKRPAA